MSPDDFTGPEILQFRKTIYDFFESHPRDLPWRRNVEPYRVLVTEVMLQQTQVERILTVYERFFSTFPDIYSLAEAGIADVLASWQGLGYYRRALNLHRTAQIITNEHQGRIPNNREDLLQLPGIGPGTAGAIMAFAYNLPVLFIETNIRRVFIHFFFPNQDQIADREIMPLVEKVLDVDNPRKWYWALTDYGVMLKKAVTNPNRRSTHYHRQSRFEGSDRQTRARILKLVVRHKNLPLKELAEKIDVSTEKLELLVDQLVKEGFLFRREENVGLMT